MDPSLDAPVGAPRRGRSLARIGQPAEQWDGAADPYARPRSPTRAATGPLGGNAYGAGSRGDLMLRTAADEPPAYFDERGGGVYDAPRGDPRVSVHTGGAGAYGGVPGRQAPPDAYGGSAPSGYGGGWQNGGQQPPPGPGWQGGGPPGGYQGGYGDAGGAYAYRRGGYAPGDAANEEQWRQIQTMLDKQNAAAAAQAQRPKAHHKALKQYLSYGSRRALYLIDSKIGKLKYQVLLLIAVAVIISVSGGKIVQLVRDMAVDEGLLENYTTYSDGVWLAWSLIIDPGYGTWPDEVVGVRMRAVTIIIVIIGILYLSVIIALIVDAVQVKMEELKKVRRRERSSSQRPACADAPPPRLACAGVVARGGDGAHGGAGLGGAVADHHPRAGVRKRQRGRRRRGGAVRRGQAGHGA